MKNLYVTPDKLKTLLQTMQPSKQICSKARKKTLEQGVKSVER